MMSLQWLAFGLLLSQASRCFSDVKIALTANMLEFKKNGLYQIPVGFEKALDGQVGTKFDDCPRSASSDPVWLEIDLGQLYSLTKIALLSRYFYGRGAQVYVGQTAVSSDGITDYRCGSRVTIPYDAPSTLTNFSCDSTNWVRYVSIRRHGYDDYMRRQYLSVCEVEAYYGAREDPGVSITRNEIETTTLLVSKGDIVKCGSSKGDFGVMWMFPNGTVIPTQASGSMRYYQDLSLSSLTSAPPNGEYTCEYTANGIKKAKSVYLHDGVGCQLSAWSSCSSSCGRGKRTRAIIYGRHGKGGECTGPYSQDCSNGPCTRTAVHSVSRLLDLNVIRATAEQGPGTYKSLHSLLAIDGDSSYSTMKCATPGRSNNPWLRINLQLGYTIREMRVKFHGKNAGGDITVNIGDSLFNNGNDNAQCGSPFPGGIAANKFIHFICFPSLWGRYINVQKTFSSGTAGYMRVCEVQVYLEFKAVFVCNEFNPPCGLVVESKTSESLYLRWLAPQNLNGNILGYEIIHWRTDRPSNKNSSLHQNTAFNVTGLSPNTNYFVSVKSVNEVKGTSSKSQPAVVSSLTLRANPVPPQRPSDATVDVSKGTITLTAPAVSSVNGPIKYVKIVVYTGDSPPDLVDADTSIHGNDWNEAAYFTLDDYNQNVAKKPFTVGSEATTSDGVKKLYTNQKLEVNVNHSIYIVVYGEDENGNLLVSSSKALTIELPKPIINLAAISFTTPKFSITPDSIDFVKVFIYTGSNPPASTEHFARSKENNQWRVASYYSLEEYERSVEGQPYSVGNGGVTSDGLTSYTNSALDEGYEYSVYIAFYSGNTKTSKLVVSSSPFTFTLGATEKI